MNTSAVFDWERPTVVSQFSRRTDKAPPIRELYYTVDGETIRVDQKFSEVFVNPVMTLE